MMQDEARHRQKDEVGHESHGGREDLGPAASPELPHVADSGTEVPRRSEDEVMLYRNPKWSRFNLENRKR
jgi:hypothetical protein